MTDSERSATDFGVVPDAPGLQTEGLQRAIDAVAAQGGTLVLPRGTYISGTLRLRSDLSLRLAEGAVLRGSSDFADYDGRYWGGGFLTAHGCANLAIEGPGTIDGADCRNPAGEEGFRGAHCLAFFDCTAVRVSGVTVERSANWAFNCVSTTDAVFERVAIRGGHDGFDAMHCRNFVFRDCDFRTGDDCIAGADNRSFVFTGCFFNTACNAFRFSCLDLTVRGCRFKGPAEAVHQVSGRTDMLAAFVHFSPAERRNCQGLEPQSDGWLIEDCTVEDVGELYAYDHRGLWQTGRPVREVVFRNVTATGLRRPIAVCGDLRRQFRLVLDRVALAVPWRTWHHHPFIDLRSFDSLTVRGLTCTGVDDSHRAISTVDGLRVDVDSLVCEPPRKPGA